MRHFVRRKQWKLPLQIRRFSRACAITLFIEVIQSFISCPRISRADVTENLSLDKRMGCTMKQMQMALFLLCLTVSFKKSKHGTTCAVHNGARQRDQSLRQQFSFLTDFTKRNKKWAICLPHSSTTFHNKTTLVSNLTAAQIQNAVQQVDVRRQTLILSN